MQSLADYLGERKIPQKDFAALVGVDKSIISKICAFKIRPSLDIAFRIKRLTGGEVPFEVWVDPVDLPTDPAFWVEFLAVHVGDILGIQRFFRVDGGKALDFAAGRSVPTGLLALKAFAYAPSAFMPRAEAAE